MRFSDIVQQVPENSISGSGHLPPFHLASIYANLIQPMGSGCAVSLFRPVYPSTVSVTPEAAIELFQKTNADCMMTVPSFLTAWAKDEKVVEYLQTLKFIVCTFKKNLMIITKILVLVLGRRTTSHRDRKLSGIARCSS